MTISHVVVMLIRVFSIALFLYALEQIAVIAPFYFSEGYYSLVSLVYIISILLVAVLFWFLPYTVIKIMTGLSSIEDKEQHGISSEQFFIIIFSAIGVYLLFNVVSDIGYWIYVTQNLEKISPILTLTVEHKASIFATGIEAIFVVCLFIGRKRLFNFIKQLRKS